MALVLPTILVILLFWLKVEKDDVDLGSLDSLACAGDPGFLRLHSRGD
jgi:hypothetical protein